MLYTLIQYNIMYTHKYTYIYIYIHIRFCVLARYISAPSSKQTTNQKKKRPKKITPPFRVPKALHPSN